MRKPLSEDDRRSRFEAMYRAHERRVLGYALRRAPVELARDAAADAFLAAWRRFDELPADPLPWLIAATRRTLANQRRAAGRQQRLAERLARAAPEPVDHRPGERGGDALRTALARLGHDDREVLTLVAWDGLSPAQAARVLGCAPATFRVRLHRARRRLAAALRDAETASRSEPRPVECRPPIAEEVSP